MSDTFLIALFVGLVVGWPLGYVHGHMNGIMRGRNDIVDAMRAYTKKQEREARP
jgi:ABC-type dipeptide/oligopeptide/nickel transport system permease subunit